MTRIAVLDDYADASRKLADWSILGPDCEVTVFTDHLPAPDRLVDRLKDFDVVCIMRERTPFPRTVLERLPKLKLLVTTGGRNASVDMAAAAKRGITVCGTGGLSEPTAELAWTLVLALHRHLPLETTAMREGRWQTTVGRNLKGKTLGLLGLGRIGGVVAGYGRAFGMDVIAWSPNLTNERAAEAGARRVDKRTLFGAADVLSIHLVLGDRSRGLVGAADLALMKPTAFLVNTSRAPIVDMQALHETLSAGRIAGAGLDVYEEEPLPADHPLRSLPNAVLTPHLGYVTEETFRIFYGDTVADIRAWLDGKPVRVIAPPK